MLKLLLCATYRETCCVQCTLKLAVQVALHIPGAYNLTVHLPIMIGTVPYRRAQSYCFTQSRFYRETQAQFADMDFLPLPPPYRETITPPPPFEGKPCCICCLGTACSLYFVQLSVLCWQIGLLHTVGKEAGGLHCYPPMCMLFACCCNNRLGFDLYKAHAECFLSLIHISEPTRR